MGLSRPLFHLFSSFQTSITIFKTNICEKYPSSIRCWDSNPRPHLIIREHSLNQQTKCMILATGLAELGLLLSTLQHNQFSHEELFLYIVPYFKIIDGLVIIAFNIP